MRGNQENAALGKSRREWSMASEDIEVQVRWEWKNAIGFSNTGGTCDLSGTDGYHYQNHLLGPN